MTEKKLLYVLALIFGTSAYFLCLQWFSWHLIVVIALTELNIVCLIGHEYFNGEEHPRG